MILRPALSRIWGQHMPTIANVRPANAYNYQCGAELIIIIIKKDWQCKVGRGRLTPYQSEDPSPTLPTYGGKEEKGKIVEDKKEESN